eukprot:jgi/Bigna1/129861/aug1.10_g4569
MKPLFDHHHRIIIIVVVLMMMRMSFGLESPFQRLRLGWALLLVVQLLVGKAKASECVPAYQIGSITFCLFIELRHMYNLLHAMDRIEIAIYDTEAFLHEMKEFPSCIDDSLEIYCSNITTRVTYLTEDKWQRHLYTLERTVKSDIDEDLRDVSRQYYDALYELPSLASPYDGFGAAQDPDYHTVAMGFWRLTNTFDKAYDYHNAIKHELNSCYKTAYGDMEKFGSHWEALKGHLKGFTQMSFSKTFSQEKPATWELVLQFWKRLRHVWDKKRRHGSCEDNEEDDLKTYVRQQQTIQIQFYDTWRTHQRFFKAIEANPRVQLSRSSPAAMKVKNQSSKKLFLEN